MKHVVYIVSDPHDKERLPDLVAPLETAGFSVTHNETVGVGDSLVGTATKNLRGGVPVVLCATVHAVARRWARKLVNAAQSIDGSKVLVVEMDEGLDLDHLSLNTVSARYYEDPAGALESLIAALNAYFPEIPEQHPLPSFDEHQDFLDQTTTATTPSIEALADFRGQLREDIAAEYPQSLSAGEFLHRTYLAREGRLTRTGVLLFGEQPAQVMPSAVIECCEYYGTDRSVASAKITIFGTLQYQIVQANKYIADRVQRGEAPSPTGPYAQPVYAYPMIAIREIIANAVAHRNYSTAKSCIHIRVFEDRIEVTSPGTWMGRGIGADEPQPIDGFAGESSRRNFRLASMLTWIRLVEGEGKGILAMAADCWAVDAPIPLIRESDGIVTVTVFPRRQREADPQPGSLVVGEIPQEPLGFQRRADLLAALDGPGQGVRVVRALTGMRGVGKTHLAAAYARAKLAEGWRLVVWINAEDEGGLLAGLAEAAAGLGLAAPAGNAVAAGFALRHWAEADGERCLLVFDNVADPGLLRRFLPAAGQAQVIITSNNRSVATLGTPVEVDVFTEAEAMSYLAARTGQADVNGAAELAAELGRLPLALAQAGAVITAQHLTHAVYLERLRRLSVMSC